MAALNPARALKRGMSANGKLIETYCATPDRSKIGALLTDDVEWVEWGNGVPPTGVRHRGRQAYVDNSGDDAHHTTITRWVEDGHTVVAEGEVRVQNKAGKVFQVRFVDLFEIHRGKTRPKTSFGALLKDPSEASPTEPS